MKPLDASNFDRPGTIEYILGKAGLYQAMRTDAGPKVEPTDKLIRIFPGRVVPPEETLIPVLMRIVDVADRLGAVNRDGEKSRIATELQKLGMTHTHGAIGQLYQDIRQAAQDVAKLPPRPASWCGTARASG